MALSREQRIEVAEMIWEIISDGYHAHLKRQGASLALKVLCDEAGRKFDHEQGLTAREETDPSTEPPETP